MKKIITIILSIALLAFPILGSTSCGQTAEKNITVVARDQGSGTREAFDTVVTDGNGNYLEMKIDGKKVYKTTSTADIQSKTGNVITKVANDKNSIGYISLGSVNDSIKVVSVNGVYPSAETVLNGTYLIQRPFVIMTNANVELSPLARDFMTYLKSEASKTHAQTAGCIYLEDPTQRANEGETPIEVEIFTPSTTLPAGEKLTISGSTSMEMFIAQAMAGYAAEYSKDVSEIFTALDLKGSSVGKSDVLKDTAGKIIGLSSSSVKEEGINSFNCCLDAVAVIVNKNNSIDNLTIKNLYGIFSGEITKFSEIV